MDIKTSELGHQFSLKELKEQCFSIFGGVSWRGKREGFAVILAMDKEERFGNNDIYLIDEFESFDTRKLVRQCGVLDHRYEPDKWIGDNRNSAADRFIVEMNKEHIQPDGRVIGPRKQERLFCVCPTQILDDKALYPYILGELKRLLDKDRRQLFLKGSKILNYLNEIEPSEVADLVIGSYPAIEALALASIEMRRYAEWVSMEIEDDMSQAASYQWHSVL